MFTGAKRYFIYFFVFVCWRKIDVWRGCIVRNLDNTIVLRTWFKTAHGSSKLSYSQTVLEVLVHFNLIILWTSAVLNETDSSYLGYSKLFWHTLLRFINPPRGGFHNPGSKLIMQIFTDGVWTNNGQGWQIMILIRDGMTKVIQIHTHSVLKTTKSQKPETVRIWDEPVLRKCARCNRHSISNNKFSSLFSIENKKYLSKFDFDIKIL